MLEPLVARCLSHDPNVIVFSEYRDNRAGMELRKKLVTHGFTHHGYTAAPSNGVLIASTDRFTGIQNPFGLHDDDYPNAIVEALFSTLRILGVYLPGQDRKRVHLRLLIATARGYDERGIPALYIGDFNSGRNDEDIELNRGGLREVDAFSTADLYEELEGQWPELWRTFHPNQREYSWYPFRKSPPAERRNGWRIDKAFASGALLPNVRSANYDHGFRTEQLSDHSALIVDIAEPSVAS